MVWFEVMPTRASWFATLAIGVDRALATQQLARHQVISCIDFALSESLINLSKAVLERKSWTALLCFLCIFVPAIAVSRGIGIPFVGQPIEISFCNVIALRSTQLTVVTSILVNILRKRLSLQHFFSLSVTFFSFCCFSTLSCAIGAYNRALLDCAMDAHC